VLENHFKPVLLKRQGVALGVWGDAGIGKSHNVIGLLKALPCQSFSSHSTAPFSSLATVFPKPKKLALWANHNLTRLAKGEAVEPASILDSLGTLLAGLAPFVLHLEDSHEANQERLEFIQKLAQMIKRIKGVGLVITSRMEPPEPFTAFKLEPLTKEQADALLISEVGTSLPTESLEFIYSKAAGNPLYTLEYFRLLSRQGSLWNDGKSWHWRKPEQNIMPVTVEALIELALGKVQDDKPLTALQAKAFLPPDTEDALWAEVADLSREDLETARLEFRQHGIFNDDTFAHPLYREVTLKNFPKAKRQQLARLALAALQDDPVKAAPFIDDAALENEKALELLKKAAQQAKESKDEILAGRLLAKAVHYPTCEEKGQLALEAARALEVVDVPLAITLAEDAARHLCEPFEALYLHASLLAGQGEAEKMHAVIKQIPEEIKKQSSWIAKYIWLLYLLGKDEERIAFWESHPEAHETCTGAVAYHVAWGYINVGKMSAASELIERVSKTTTLTEKDQSDLLEAKATICFYSGNYAQAETYFSEALVLCQGLGSPPATANVLRNRSVARLQQGQFRESLPDLEKALTIYSETGRSLYYAETLIMMSYSLVELGIYERTEAVLLEALDIFRRVEPQPKRVDVLTQLAGLYLDWPTQTYTYLALKYAREAEREARGFAISSRYMAVATLARCETAAHNPQQGLAYANEALEIATRLNVLDAIVNSHHARGLALLALHQTNEAREAFTRACQLAEEHGLMLEATKYGLELDRLNNDIENARKRVQWLEKRGLMNGVNIAKRYFPELTDATKITRENLEIQLRLDILGKMQFSHRGETSLIQGRKRKEFLALLLEARLAGRSEVSRLELLDALYSNEDELKALQNLKSLIHSLRSSFSEGIILTTSIGHSLGGVKSDAEEFLESGDTSL
jgi:Tetratricopeptide repeat